jgi:NADH dehydrogenase
VTSVKVLVTGGTGYVGSAVVHELRARNVEVRALVRSPGRASRLEAWGVELATGDVTDPASVLASIDGCTHVVHLVAILRGSREEFDRVMVGGTRNVIAAARHAGVARLVLMSALGVDESTRTLVPYYGAKWHMEQDVKASGLEHVILRPSFVFGASGGALPMFVRQVRLSPVVTVIGDGTGRLQPIWLDDVAAHVTAAVELPAAANRTFELGGPDAVTWNELYRRIARTLGKHRTVVHVPFGLAKPAARLTEWIPGSPLTADQVTMLEGPDNVVGDGGLARATFGLPLLALDEQLRRAVA